MKRAILFGIVFTILAMAVSVTAQQASAPAQAQTQAPAPSPASVPAVAPAPKASMEIARMEICGDVADRKPVDTATVFPASREKVYCYLEFKDVKKETTVNVVWTLGQNEMSRIPLTIKPYAKFRTWANKELHGMKGDWKVDVLDEKGALLQSASFKVQ